MSEMDPLFNFHFDQDNAEDLSQERTWPNPEVIKSNAPYGLAGILKEYAGLPDNYPLRVSIENALLVGGAANIAKRSITDHILTPSEIRTPIIKEQTDKLPIPIGFGYLYAKTLLDKFSLSPIEESDRKGTIVFPYKVIKTSSLDFDHAAYADQLNRLPEKFQPVYVCLFYSYVRDIAPIYRKAGIPVVTAGHRLDPLFLYRFHDICRRFRYSASNELGTNLFLSVDDGCRYFYIDGPDIKRVGVRDKAVGNQAGDIFEKNREESRSLFKEPVEELTAEQIAYSDAFIGKKSMLSPNELKKLLLKEQKMYEKRPWWHGEKRLLRYPDVSDFSWQEFPPGLGWDGLDKTDKKSIRWMGLENNAWVELFCPHRLQKQDTVLTCDFHIETEGQCDMEISVNGLPLPVIEDKRKGKNYSVEALVSAELMEKSIEHDTVRIGFRATNDDIHPDDPKARHLPVGVCRISLEARR